MSTFQSMIKHFSARGAVRALAVLLAAGFAQAQTSSIIAITHITVINPDQANALGDMTVTIAHNRIEKIASSRRAPIPKGAAIIDGSGKFLIPGMWDMHVHTHNAERDFAMEIANGVLGVRNMAGRAEVIFKLRKDTADGTILGPKIFACGPVVNGPSADSSPSVISVHTPEEARSAVDRLQTLGADFIKVYDGLSRPEYFAIAEEAKRLKMPFAGHVSNEITIREAVEAGQRSIEHGAALEGTSTSEDEVIGKHEVASAIASAMKTQKDFPSIPEAIARTGNLLLDHYSENKARKLYRDFVTHDTYLTPTLVIEHAITFIDSISKQPDARLVYVSNREQEGWRPEVGFLTRYRTPAYIAYRKREYAAIQKGLLLAHKEGVQLLAGTDVGTAYTYPGFSLHEELRLLVEAGLTPREALQTATTNAARFLHLDHGLGTIELGSQASFVILNANPLSDIQNVDKIDQVIFRGTVFSREKLDGFLKKAEVGQPQ